VEAEGEPLQVVEDVRRQVVPHALSEADVGEGGRQLEGHRRTKMRIVAATNPGDQALPRCSARQSGHGSGRGGAIGLSWRMLSMSTFMGQGLSAPSPMPATVTARMAARAARRRQA
jgi:hypothetical protein